MFHNIIKEEALFIADSHFNKNRGELLSFLKKIDSKEIECSQLFLMGDMFDFISSESRYFVNINKEVITLLDKLSKEMEIVYLEGNHDYNMKSLFNHIKVYKREEQPIFYKYGEKTVALAHGDIFVNNSYDLYCKIIRNSTLLKFLNFLDFNYWLSKKIENALLGKNICGVINSFEELAKKRVTNYKTDIIIEGHFHQGKEYEIDSKRYINVPSLFCSKEYLILKDNKFNKYSI